MGSSAARNDIAESPTVMIESLRCRARLPKVRSRDVNQHEPRFGTAYASATARTTNPASITRSIRVQGRLTCHRSLDQTTWAFRFWSSCIAHELTTEGAWPVT